MQQSLFSCSLFRGMPFPPWKGISPVSRGGHRLNNVHAILLMCFPCEQGSFESLADLGQQGVCFFCEQRPFLKTACALPFFTPTQEKRNALKGTSQSRPFMNPDQGNVEPVRSPSTRNSPTQRRHAESACRLILIPSFVVPAHPGRPRNSQRTPVPGPGRNKPRDYRPPAGPSQSRSARFHPSAPC